MWLINCHSFALEFHHDPNKVKYAILSHTWGNDEVTFKDMANLEQARSLTGFEKIRGTCEMAIKHGFEYAWVDTCCIDKSSSAELSEAINSMFGWYQLSDVCYVYLSDVSCEPFDSETISDDDFCQSRWFTRGWTLQELIAPRDLQLYDKHWNVIARLQDGGEVVDAIVRKTGISRGILTRGTPRCPGTGYMMGPLAFTLPAHNHGCPGDKIAGMCGYCHRARSSPAFLDHCSIAERMSWAARRDTTRPEDRAYSLMGIFGVNMPLLYGEGTRAFARLQEEIMKTTDDQSILAYSSGGSLFAESPDSFAAATFIKSYDSTFWLSNERKAVEMKATSKSIEMSMLLCPLRHPEASTLYLGILACSDRSNGLSRPAILLQQSKFNQKSFYRHPGGHLLKISALSPRLSIEECDIYAQNRVVHASSQDITGWLNFCHYNLKDIYFEENLRLLPKPVSDLPFDDEITSVTTPPLKITVHHGGTSRRWFRNIRGYPYPTVRLGRRKIKSRRTFQVTEDNPVGFACEEDADTEVDECLCYYVCPQSFPVFPTGMQAFDKIDRFGIISLDTYAAETLWIIWGWDRGHTGRNPQPGWCYMMEDEEIPHINDPELNDMWGWLQRRGNLAYMYKRVQRIIHDLHLNADSKHTIQRGLRVCGRQTVEASIWQTTLMDVSIHQLDIDINEL